MNIAVILGAIKRGGAERQAILCVSELRKRGHCVDLLYYHPFVEYQELLDEYGVKPYYVDSSNFLHRCWVMGSIFRKNKYEIVHSFGGDSVFTAVIAGKMAGIKTIFGGFRVEYARNRLFRLLHYMIDYWLQCWIVNSRAIAESMVKRVRIHPGKFAVLYNGISMQKFQCTSNVSEIKNTLGLEPDKKIIAMIARLHSQKNYCMFLDAAGLVIRKEPNTRFIVVGDGPDEQVIKNYARQIKVDEHVRFLGRRSDIPEILSIVDISVLTSDYEGFSNTIIESMAAGKPIVATDYKGYDEILKHEVNALVCPRGQSKVFAEAIIRLLNDPILRQTLANNGTDYVRTNCLPEIMAEKLETIYRSKKSGI